MGHSVDRLYKNGIAVDHAGTRDAMVPFDKAPQLWTSVGSAAHLSFVCAGTPVSRLHRGDDAGVMPADGETLRYDEAKPEFRLLLRTRCRASG